MPKYSVQIQEISAKTVEIEASSAEEALKNAERQHRDSRFVLNADDFEAVRFRPVCPECECAYDRYSGDVRVVNEGFPDEQWLCFYCRAGKEETGELTRCDCCGEVFSPLHLKTNPENAVREICPYCGEVWCD